MERTSNLWLKTIYLACKLTGVGFSRLDATMNAECWQHIATVRTPNPMKNPLEIIDDLMTDPNPPAPWTLSPIGANAATNTTRSISAKTDRSDVNARLLKSLCIDSGTTTRSDVMSITNSLQKS